MDFFQYRDRNLYCEDLPLSKLAEQYGTPLFVYSQKTLLRHLGELQRAFAAVEPLIC
jgi:diaminopimelate decarboxylase